MILTCRKCGAERDVGISPDFLSIQNCGNPDCDGQETFTGFPQILTQPQQPDARGGRWSRFVARVTTSYINILVAILVNLVVMAVMGVLTYYIVRSAVEKQIPTAIQQELQSSPPQK